MIRPHIIALVKSLTENTEEWTFGSMYISNEKRNVSIFWNGGVGTDVRIKGFSIEKNFFEWLTLCKCIKEVGFTLLIKSL